MGALHQVSILCQCPVGISTSKVNAFSVPVASGISIDGVRSKYGQDGTTVVFGSCHCSSIHAKLHLHMCTCTVGICCIGPLNVRRTIQSPNTPCGVQVRSPWSWGLRSGDATWTAAAPTATAAPWQPPLPPLASTAPPPPSASIPAAPPTAPVPPPDTHTHTHKQNEPTTSITGSQIVRQAACVVNSEVTSNLMRQMSKCTWYNHPAAGHPHSTDRFQVICMPISDLFLLELLIVVFLAVATVVTVPACCPANIRFHGRRWGCGCLHASIANLDAKIRAISPLLAKLARQLSCLAPRVLTTSGCRLVNSFVRSWGAVCQSYCAKQFVLD